MEVLLLAFFLGGLVVAANIVEKSENSTYHQFFDWVLLSFGLPLFVMGVTYLILPTSTLITTQGDAVNNPRGTGVLLIFMGLWGALVSFRVIRKQLARLLPFNPKSAVHALALLLSGLLIGNTLITLADGGLENLAETAVSTSSFDIILQQLLLVFLAFLGVGLFIRRDDAAMRERLGLERPTPEQLWLGVRWIIALVALQWVGGIVSLLLDPEQLELLEGISGTLFGELDTVWEWFAIAFTVGMGEELLFRGAMQPVFGIWFTSIVFTIAHVQYGFTPITLVIFLIALALGHIRRQTNTTVAIFVHFGYDFALGLLTLLAAYLEQSAP